MGWPGVPTSTSSPSSRTVSTSIPCRSAVKRSRLLRGLLQRHSVAAVPRRDRQAGVRREWWNAYVEVNRRFAEATSKAAAEGATVWIQDYQLQLGRRCCGCSARSHHRVLPAHPVPAVELFMQMPWRREIVEGLLGADLIGFHLPGGAQNFMFLARRLAGQQTSRGTVGVRSKLGVVQVGFRTVRVGAFPISIDSGKLDELSRPQVDRDRAKQIRKELGNPKHIMLGVDRLDYTKGIDVRLDALYELLQEGRVDPADTVMVQLATPSRERVESYVQMRGRDRATVSRINGEYAEGGDRWCTTSTAPSAGTELIAFFVLPDVMLVTPLRDGMNLVAKDYVACRSDLGGALLMRVHRRRSRTPSSLPVQPPRPRRRQGQDGEALN
ncbi:trehalose-6-phosphate synthase, partial [Rhodococcus hoagii]|nr:trehalose-6-phosphate synthase [Prescottella equi]